MQIESADYAQVQAAFEQIITDVKRYTPDSRKGEFKAWEAQMRKLGPWGIAWNYWMSGIVDQADTQDARNCFITDINALLKLQHRNLLPANVSDKLNV